MYYTIQIYSYTQIPIYSYTHILIYYTNILLPPCIPLHRSEPYIISAILSPVLGAVVDKLGRRTWCASTLPLYYSTTTILLYDATGLYKFTLSSRPCSTPLVRIHYTTIPLYFYTTMRYYCIILRHGARPEPRICLLSTLTIRLYDSMT